MNLNDNLFVKLDYKIEGNNFDSKCNGAHFNFTNRDKNVSKYLVAGGFYNKKSGTIVFTARNLEEAQQFAKNNTLIKKGEYKYEILNYNFLSNDENKLR